MKKIAAVIALGTVLGIAWAKLPPPPPQSEADKAAEVKKKDEAKAKEAAELAKAQDKAVANYKKNMASAKKQ
jgi:hypothetical protein